MHGTCDWQVDYGDGSTYQTSTGGSGSVSQTFNLCHTYTTSGTFVLTLSITPAHNICADQYNIVIPVHGATFTGNNVCAGNATVFNATSVGSVSSWNWNFGDGTTSTLQNPTHIYSAPGTYNVTLVAASTCNDTIHQVVIVYPIPVANFSLVNQCFGAPVCFTDSSTVLTGSIATWNWDFGDPSSGAANTSALQNPCHTFTAPSPSTFIVTLFVISDHGCQSPPQVSLPVSPYPIPVAAFSSVAVCLNSPTTFTDASTTNPITWAWNFGDGGTSVLQNPSHLYTNAGIDTITLIVTTNHGCKDTVAHPTVINPNPVALFSDSAQGCSPVIKQFINLSTTSAGQIISTVWNFPGGTPVSDATSGMDPSQIITYNTPGTYDVSIITTNTFGCKDTLLYTQYIHVYGWPVADFCVTPQSATIHDPTFYFCKLWSPDVATWSWNFGDGTIDVTNTNPVHSYSSSVTNNDFYNFKPSVTVSTIHRCRDSISKSIDVIPEFTFFIANTFTPNKDGINDFYYGKGVGIKKYDIMVFDRWGNLIWQCDHEGKNTDWDAWGQEGMPSSCKWDGIVQGGGLDMSGFGGQVSQIDVYVWKVKLTDVFDINHRYMGIVNIVR